VAVGEKTVHQVDHLGNVIRSRGDDLRFLDSEPCAVFKEGRRVRSRVFPDIDSLLCRFADDLVVDIRDVHHMQKLPFALEMPPQNIFKNIGSEVPDVRKIMHRRTARIHPHGDAVRG